MIYEIIDMQPVYALFQGWEETPIWSCLQNIMGRIYANDLYSPTAAIAVLGDFIFFAGKPDRELASYRPSNCSKEFMIFIPQTEDWTKLFLQIYGNNVKVISRYATKKEPADFDREKLQQIVSTLPAGYELRQIDEPLYHLCKASRWSADLVSQFPTYEEYQRLGLGFVIVKDSAILSGASSYSRYQNGLEIEVDTREDWRRKGLACICSARLILECLDKGLYPSWDAHNQASISLAQKLGYHYSHTYTALLAYITQ